MDTVLFNLCCQFIRLLSDVTGLTYEEVNSILFIYGEPVFIGIYNLVVLFCYRKQKGRFAMLWGYNLVYAVLCMGVFARYMAYSLHDACLLAYKDLDLFGKVTGIGYMYTNFLLIILIPVFLTIMIFFYMSGLIGIDDNDYDATGIHYNRKPKYSRRVFKLIDSDTLIYNAKYYRNQAWQKS